MCWTRIKNLIKAKEVNGDIIQGNTITVNVVNNYNVPPIKTTTEETLDTTADIKNNYTTGTVVRLQVGADGREPDYKDVVVGVSLLDQDKLHMESLGSDHGISFIIDFDQSIKQLNVKYHFSAKSTADMLKNAQFIMNAMEVGTIAFMHEGIMAIGPIPAHLLFDQSVEETKDIIGFIRSLMLIESFYGIDMDLSTEFDQADQEWVEILSEGIHGRAVPCNWENASFTGMLHPANKNQKIEDLKEATEGKLKYGYTTIGDLTIGKTHIGEVKVRYELESAKIANIQEVQEELNRIPFRDRIPVTIELVPSENNRGTRRVIFE